jgi:hypothetical protein
MRKRIILIGVVCLLAHMPGLRAADAPLDFPTPEAAVAALGDALISTNNASMRSLCGAAWDDLINPDEVQEARELSELSAALQQTNRLQRVSDTSFELEVGRDNWPFPIPIVRGPNGWFFDAAAGREEILNRRIGRNELHVLATMRAYVEAQREYAGRDRDGDDVLEYAQKLISTPGNKDGLYWPRKLDGSISPLGPLFARAEQAGYRARASTSAPEPFHGYYFKLLTRQGKHAPGGRYDYVINGNMIGGFALVAWPAEYRESGVMTFIVNQQGRVYQKDLGTDTVKTANKMKAYDVDETWGLSPD